VNRRKELILGAARRALEYRNRLKLADDEPASPIDNAAKVGLQVWLRDHKTYDGGYSKPLVIISSRRPLGRMSFTCAHEIGHHAFQHGVQLEEIFEKKEQSEDELVAHSFAAHFLMPRKLVLRAFKVRGLDVKTPTVEGAFRVACWLGVGYETLLNHMYYQLDFISRAQLDALNNWREPKQIKSQIAGVDTSHEDVHYVDEHWTGRPLDCRIDDFVCSPLTLTVTLERGRLEPVGRSDFGLVYRASTVGEDSAQSENGWGVNVRVSKRGFTGRAEFRHEEEDPDE